MRRSTSLAPIFTLLILGLLVAPEASAQQAAGIAGVAKDATGAALPGVTVEASSPALIEKVRSTVTDGEGQYRIIDLRPGTYDVTFTLPGFSTVRREGIVLTAGFTAAINADMKVGALEETVTVTGATPLVDTVNARQQLSVTDDVLDALPTGTTGISNLAAFTPGLTTTAGSNVGGAAGTYNSSSVIGSTFHGKSSAITQYDGMSINNTVRPGATGFIISPATLQEWVVETGGGLAESNAGASIAMNVVPREGGNTFRGGAQALYSSDNLQGENLSPELKAKGLTTVSQISYLYDTDFNLGGPIRKDKLWFFTAFRAQGNQIQQPGIFFNATQGTPFFTPGEPGYRQDLLVSSAVRATWQVSSKNKVNLFAEPQKNCVCRGRGEFVAPEAAYRWDFWPTGLYQGTWNGTLTNKLLFEAAAGVMWFDWPNFLQPETGNAISTTDQNSGFIYGSTIGWPTLNAGPRSAPRYTQRFSTTYVTGSHAFKTGLNIEEATTDLSASVNQNIAYRFRGQTPTTAVPNQLTLYADPFRQVEKMNANMGIFAQDSWTVKHLTLNLGLRFEYVNVSIPEQNLPAGQYVPARHTDPISNVPNWKDVLPRLGGSYDLFGNGKTALKASLGKFVSSTTTEIAQAINPIFANSTTTRNWNDLFFDVGDPRRGNFKPDCDLKNPKLNDECADFGNQNFGTPTVRANYADNVIHGWGNRQYLWDVATEVQQQVGARASLRVGYYRNWDGNLTVTNNLEVVPSDHSTYCITAPTNSGLPGGGGYPVCGLTDVNRNKFGRTNTLVENSANFTEYSRVSDFFAVNLSTRFGKGIQLGGGIDTGRSVSDKCGVVDTPAQATYDYTTATTPTYCHVETPFSAQTQIKLFGGYPLPYGFMVSGVLQNLSGPQILATYAATNAEIAGSLGRNLSSCPADTGACTATALVPLVQPQTMFADRRTQLDVRFSKHFKVGARYGVDASLDVYNLTNSSSVITLVNTFGSQWQQPTAVLDARMFQVNGRLTF